MVRAAYSSGHPSIGVGAGNTPALIDETAHIKMAVSSILLSKTFDNGVICASEQSVIVQDSVYDACKKEFLARGAYFLNEEERKIVGAKIIVDGRLNADIVGQSVQSLAKVCLVRFLDDSICFYRRFFLLAALVCLTTVSMGKCYYQDKKQEKQQGKTAGHTHTQTAGISLELGRVPDNPS